MPQARPALRGGMVRCCGVLVSLALLSPLAGATSAETAQHQRGDKYSPLTQINRDNVAELALAWEYHTGDVPPEDTAGSLIAFEDQPTLVEGNLVVCTTARRLIALDPATGKERWVFDPQDRKVGMQKCRGIATWTDTEAAADANCRTRIFLGTSDHRLLAIDARSGKLCPDFGENPLFSFLSFLSPFVPPRQRVTPPLLPPPTHHYS